MNIGAHISAAGGVINLGKRAKEIGASTFQFFSRSPQGGKAPELTKELVNAFFKDMKELNIKNYYIHGPYYTNLASPKPKIYNNSIRILREELERGTTLKARGVMFHPGSAKDTTHKKAMQQVTEGVGKILDEYTGSCALLLENAAGAGEVVGDSLKELGEILHIYKKKKKNIGICLDTQHMFASGYDIRTKKGVDTVFKEVEEHIGWENVYLFHMNDSKTEFESKKDRHENIGKGFIGEEGFAAILNHKAIKNIDIVLETPKKTPEEDIVNIETLKRLMKS